MDFDEASILARRNTYLLLSAGYADPICERFELLVDEDFREAAADSVDYLIQETPIIASVDDDECIRPDMDLDTFLRDPDWTVEDVQEEFKSVFGLTISEDCPPHEVEFCEKTDLFYRSQLMADIGGFYNAFGLEMDDDSPERVDHIRLELEFMYFLLTKLIHGIRNDHSNDELKTVQSAMESFFEEHLGWWLPAFGRSVQDRSESDFYDNLSELLCWLSTRERLEFGFPVFEERPEPNVPEFDSEGSCFECGIDEITTNEMKGGV